MNMLEKILEAMRLQIGQYVSGEELSGRLSVTRTTIWKLIHQLQAAGYVIEALPHLGYRLVSSPDRLLPFEIKAGLQTRVFGRKVFCFPETSSTNDRALELAAQGQEEGTLVAAEFQTRGRGRRERSWVSKAGQNLLFSLVFRPPWIAEQASLLTLLAAVSVVRAIRKVTGLSARIKWPNDVFLKDGKVAGILTEMRGQSDAIAYVVSGIGLNVNSVPNGALRQPVVSLAKQLGKPVPRLPLLRQMLLEIENLYFLAREKGPDPILEAWREYSLLNGSEVRVELPEGRKLEGMVLGVDESGALLVREERGVTRRVTSGEVFSLRSAGKETAAC